MTQCWGWGGPRAPQERVTTGPRAPQERGHGGAPAGEPSSAREQRATRAPRAVCRAAGVWNFTSTAFNIVRFHSQCLNLR